MNLTDEIMEQVRRLDDPQRRRVLEFARRLTSSLGTPGHDLARFAGAINRLDLDSMSKAIKDACERIEPNALVASCSIRT